MKQENLSFSGKVSQELGNSQFKIESTDIDLKSGIQSIPEGHEVLCTISGKIRKNFIKIISGDDVVIEVSPYDLTRGRIVKRLSFKDTTSYVNYDDNEKKIDPKRRYKNKKK